MTKEKAVRCTCGKLVAKMRDGKIFVYCKGCKREIELQLEPRAIEPRADNA